MKSLPSVATLKARLAVLKEYGPTISDRRVRGRRARRRAQEIIALAAQIAEMMYPQRFAITRGVPVPEDNQGRVWLADLSEELGVTLSSLHQRRVTLGFPARKAQRYGRGQEQGYVTADEAARIRQKPIKTYTKRAG